MSRSRMINDSFYDDPDLAEYTVETRFALLMFLTCPASNIIGVYRVNWRSLGAGVGWTKEQSLNAAKLIQELGGIEIEENGDWVWVKEWWKHNSLKGALTGKVSKRAAQELAMVPDFWKQRVIEWINSNDTEGACKPLISPLQGSGGNHTTNPIPISIPTPTDTDTDTHRHSQAVDIDELVDAAEHQAKLTGTKVKNWVGWRAKVRARLECGRKPEDLQALEVWRQHKASRRVQSTSGSRTPPDPNRRQKLQAAVKEAGINLST